MGTVICEGFGIDFLGFSLGNYTNSGDSSREEVTAEEGRRYGMGAENFRG